MRNKQRGFTLVELSIVLVIIGLLIGGILAAQSMIETTKILAFVKQIQQSDIAVSNYQTKFNGLPGDLQGNNNGVIEDANVNGQSIYFNGENANFWSQLNLNGFDATHHYSSTISSSFNSDPNNLNAPTFKLGTNASALIFTNLPSQNLYLIADFSAMTNSNLCMIPSVYTGSFNTISYFDTLALDSKMDDGNLATGNVTAGYYISNSYSICAQSNPKCFVGIYKC